MVTQFLKAEKNLHELDLHCEEYLTFIEKWNQRFLKLSLNFDFLYYHRRIYLLMFLYSRKEKKTLQLLKALKDVVLFDLWLRLNKNTRKKKRAMESCCSAK